MARPSYDDIMSNSDDLKNLGRNIAYWRNKKKISQDTLALEAEIGRRTIHRIEVGSTDVRFSTLSKIAKALGVEIKELLKDID